MSRDDSAPKSATPPPASRRTEETLARDAERKARLAAALRQNLKRRKAPDASDASGSDER